MTIDVAEIRTRVDDARATAGHCGSVHARHAITELADVVDLILTRLTDLGVLP